MSRYRIITIDQLMLFVLALALSLLASTVFAGAREIRGFTLTVSNLEAAVAFYEQALGFSVPRAARVASVARESLEVGNWKLGLGSAAEVAAIPSATSQGCANRRSAPRTSRIRPIAAGALALRRSPRSRGPDLASGCPRSRL